MQLLYPDFKERFNSWWCQGQVEGWEGFKFMKKLQLVKSKLKDCNKVSFKREKEKHFFKDCQD